jgi:hypothetical protein
MSLGIPVYECSNFFPENIKTKNFASAPKKCSDRPEDRALALVKPSVLWIQKLYSDLTVIKATYLKLHYLRFLNSNLNTVVIGS